MKQKISIEDRLSSVEHRLERLEKTSQRDSVVSAPKAVVHTDATTVRADATTKPIVYEKTDIDIAIGKGIAWLQKDWLMKLGAFLLLLALAWFVNYAFMNSWVGPVGRISMGMIFGLGIMLIGHVKMPAYKHPGQVLVGTGGIMMLVTLFAARNVYDMFTPLTALFMMSVVVVAMASIAVIRKAPAIAYIALLGGAAVPYLIESSIVNETLSLAYIFLLTLGMFIVVALRGWRPLVLVALAITGVYSSVFSNMPETTVWLFMASFFTLFFVSTVAAMLRDKKTEQSDLIASGVNGLLLLFWIAEYVSRDWSSIVVSLVAVVLVLVALLIKKAKGMIHPLYLYAGLAVVYIGVATAFELDGAALTIAYTIEAFMALLLTHYLFQDKKSTEVVSFLQVIPLLLSLEHMIRYSSMGFPFNKEFFVLLLLLLSFVGTSIVLKTYERIKTNSFADMLSIFYLLSFGYLFILIWLFSHNIFQSENTAKGLALIVYTFIGIKLFFHGAYKEVQFDRVLGGVIIGGVVLRLLLIEVWVMALAGRIVTFLVIGALLVSTAFITKLVKKE